MYTIQSEYTRCPESDSIVEVNIIVYISKKKKIPLQAWTGPEGSKRLRLPDFKTVGTCRW